MFVSTRMQRDGCHELRDTQALHAQQCRQHPPSSRLCLTMMQTARQEYNLPIFTCYTAAVISST